MIENVKYKAADLAKDLKIDDTLVYVDENEGWKISRFVNITDEFDFKNEEHISFLAKHLKQSYQTYRTQRNVLQKANPVNPSEHT